MKTIKASARQTVAVALLLLTACQAKIGPSPFANSPDTSTSTGGFDPTNNAVSNTKLIIPTPGDPSADPRGADARTHDHEPR